MLKEFFLRKMLKSKLPDVPEAQQEKLVEAFKNNPELFQKIADEVQEQVKAGKSQMNAAIEAAKKYEKELSKAFNQ